MIWITTKKRRIIFTVVAVCLLVAGVLLDINFDKTSSHVEYEGTKTFVSVEEYADFVHYLTTEEDVDILDMNSLSPVWIQYTIRLPRATTFPFEYDKMSASSVGTNAIIICAFMVATGITGLLFILFTKDD